MRIYALMSRTICVLVAVVLACVACSTSRDPAADQTMSPTSHASPAPFEACDREERDTLGIIYSDERGRIHQIDIDGSDHRSLELPNGTIVGSPDGRWFAIEQRSWERGRSSLWLAPSAAPSCITRIARDDRNIIGTAWTRDGDVVVFETPFTEPLVEGTDEKLVAISADGARRAVTTLRFGGVYLYRVPAGVSAEGWVYWSQEIFDGAGGTTGWGRTHLRTGATERFGTGNESFIWEEDWDIAPDAALFAFIADEHTVMVRTIPTRASRVVYEAASDEYRVVSLSISPTGDRVAIGVRTGTPDHPRGGRVRLVDLASGRSEMLLDDAAHPALMPVRWSPDGRYLWVADIVDVIGEEDVQPAWRDVLLDLLTGERFEPPTGFEAWIAPSAE